MEYLAKYIQSYLSINIFGFTQLKDSARLFFAFRQQLAQGPPKLKSHLFPLCFELHTPQGNRLFYSLLHLNTNGVIYSK